MEAKKNPQFSDYLYILYKWKKFLIVNLLFIIILATVISFLIPKQYKATATIMIPPESQSAFGGLSSLFGDKSSIASVGSTLFGASNTSEDVLLGLLNSRSALTDVINKFDLMDYYEINDKNMDKAIKAFRNDIISEPNEYGMIDFSVINKNPNKSAEIANYLVTLVDSLNIKFNIQQAKNNRIFVEKRYNQNTSDLRAAEDSLYQFQKKYDIVAVPDQLQVTVKAAAEIESQLIKKEMEAFFAKQAYGDNAPQYLGIKAEINLLKNKVQELKSSPNLNSTSNVFYSFKEMPDIAIKYLRTFREVEIQQAIQEIVLPMYEQAKVEEQKSIPTVLVIDKAVPPQLKYSPKKAFIIAFITLISLFLFVIFVFIGEKLFNPQKSNNPLEQKIKNFYLKIVKVYKMKW